MDQTIDDALQEALSLLKRNRAREASAILARVLARDPDNEQGWHMLSYTLQDPQKRTYALRRVLAINPANRAARAALQGIAGTATVPAPSTALPSQPAPDSQEAVLQAPQPADETPTPLGSTHQPSPPALAGTGAAGPPPSSLATRRGLSKGHTATATRKIIPFPGTTFAPERIYTPGQRLKIRARLSWRRLKGDWNVFSQSGLAVFGLVLIVLFALMAIAHPILMATIWPRAIYDPVTGFDMAVFPHPLPPAWVEGGSRAHLLGTDTLGRDVLSMLLAATTPTFVVGLTAALSTAFVGTLMSVIAAYFRGVPDAVITNLADVFLLFPAPIIMVIVGARFRDLGPVPLGMIYGLVTGAGATVIVMRAHALQVVSKPFMEAAYLAGGGALHIITKHLLPAMLPLAALQMMIAVSGAVVADGFISFFGLTRIVNNWGTLIYDAFVYGGIGGVSTSMWHMLLPAAICFSLFALGFYLVSRGLHRVASPTIREEQTA